MLRAGIKVYWSIKRILTAIVPILGVIAIATLIVGGVSRSSSVVWAAACIAAVALLASFVLQIVGRSGRKPPTANPGGLAT